MISGVFCGALARFEPEGEPTGIFKLPVDGRVRLGREGIVGDVQADRRVHGGPDKAVHHYAAENYPLLAAAFPAIAADLIPGSIGENLSTTGWTEDNVCIGDTFRCGTALLQVSQPRSPCWKIDRRFGTEGMTRFIAQRGIAGWYYRVIAGGEIGVGDAFELDDRPAPEITLARLWRAGMGEPLPTDELAAMLLAPGLPEAWVARLETRLNEARRGGHRG